MKRSCTQVIKHPLSRLFKRSTIVFNMNCCELNTVNCVYLLRSASSLRGKGADPGFDHGGPQIVTGLNCQWCAAASCERNEPFQAWGLGPALGPQKLLGISLLNMHSLHFGVPFYTIFEIIKY